MGNSVLQALASRAPVMKTVSLPRGRHRLHTMPTSTGYEIRHDTHYDWNGHKRGQTPFTVLQHTISGEGCLLYERRQYRLKTGDTMLVIVPHNHRYWLEKGGRWEFFWISMSGQEAVRIHRTIQAQAGPVLKLRSDTIERIARMQPAPDRWRRRNARRGFGNSLHGRWRALRRCVRVAERGVDRRRRRRHEQRRGLCARQSRQAPFGQASRGGVWLQPGSFLAHVHGEQRRATRRVCACRSACDVRRGFCRATRSCR